MYGKKLRSLLALILAVVMLAALGTACGKAAAPDTSSESAKGESTTAAVKETTAEPTPVELAPAELLWYVVGAPQDDMDSVLTEVNKTLKEKINATLKLNILDWGSYVEKIKVLLNSGADMDLCFTSSWFNDYVINSNNGLYLPLDDLLSKYGQGLYSGVPQKYWDSVKVNGKIYGTINYQLAYTQKAAFLKKDIVEKYNMAIPEIKTVRDLEPMFDIIKANEPEMYGALASTLDVLGFPYMNNEMGWKYEEISGASPFGIDRAAKDYKVINLHTTKEYMDFWMTLRGWFKKGYVPLDAVSIKDVKAEAATGRYFAVPGAYKPGVEIEQKKIFGYDVIAVPLNKPISGALLGTLTAIPISSKNPERAMMMLNLLNTDKTLYNLLCHGIENKHYKKVNDNTIAVIDGAGYAPALDWEFGNQFNGYFLEGQSDTIWDDTIKANNEAEMSTLIGFSFNTESVKNEKAQIDDILKTYTQGLMTGSIDPEKEIPKMLDKLKAAGIDKVQTELQKQLDAWRAANG